MIQQACSFPAKRIKGNLNHLPEKSLMFNKGREYKRLMTFILLLFILVFSHLSSFSQQKITGKVLSFSNQPLEGVSITVSNTKSGTTTATDGRFEILSTNAEWINASLIGYQSQKIKIGAEKDFTIILTPLAINLEEVVLTGYSTQRIKEITGSVSSVKTKDLVAVPAGQAEQMLQGRVAGLTVISSGEPGAPVNIRLHGVGNFGDVAPLYIIDGIPGEINSINPYDIESLHVLKDAGAYSIYGVRGANGVIIVTTRKGKSGRTKITYDFYIGQQQPLKGLDLLNPQENAELTWLAKRNSGEVDANGNPKDQLYGNGPQPVLPDYHFAGTYRDTLYEGSPLVDASLYNLDPNNPPIYQIVPFNKNGTDWFHELYKPAISQNHSLSVSGGSEKNLYLFSIGYLDQQGTLMNTHLKRFTSRINTQFSLGNNFRIGENLQLSYSENPQPLHYQEGVRQYSDASDALFIDPSYPIYDIQGGYNGGYGTDKGPENNAVARRHFAKDFKNYNWQAFGNAFAEIDFLDDFILRTSIGGNFTNFYSDIFQRAGYYYPSGGLPNSYSIASGNLGSWTWTNTLGYNRKFSLDHNLKIMLGTEMITNRSQSTGGRAINLPFTDPSYWSLSNGDPLTKTNYSISSETRLQSFFGRAEYGFKDRYFITGTLRNDGASVFGPENRYGWFPSVGLAWRVTEENFMRSIDWITDLKLRGSWGKTGFYGNTDPNNQYTLYGGSPGDAWYDLNGISTGAIQQGFRAVRLGNTKTGWQEDVVSDIGLETILWNGKLSITADWYNKTSKGLLFPIALPDVLGDVIAPNINTGEIKNTGIDLTIGSKGNFSKNFHWDALITFSHYKNKIIQLNSIPYFFDFFGWVKNEVGYPMGSFYGYKITGLFQDSAEIAKSPAQDGAAPGRFKFADVNGYDSLGQLSGTPDGLISDADRIHFGNPHPDFTLGINIGLQYKNFDFSTFLYGSFGNDVLNLNSMGLDNFGTGWPAHSKKALYESWTPDNRNTSIPRQETTVNFSNDPFFTTYTMEDGSYIRNKSIILGYTLSAGSLKRLKVERLRFYVQLVNLFTITNYSGLDPELSSTGVSPLSSLAQKSSFGIDTGNYPNNQKQFLFGINLGF